MKEYPSQARLKELFDYDEAGFLVWRDGSRKGEPAGQRGFNSELRHVYDIGVSGKTYKGTRLIWIWHKKENPKGRIYTKNGIYSDSRIENLTLNTGSAKTFRAKPRGGSDYIGVYRRDGSWRVEFQGKSLGHFSSERAAARAYDVEAENKYGKGMFTSNGIDKSLDVEKYRKKLSGNQGASVRCRGSQSDFIGVSRYITKKKGVRFSVKFRKKHAGIFDTEHQAARAYNIAAHEHYGEHAVLNDIPDPLGHGDPF